MKQKKTPVSVVVIGAGGYGQHYLQTLFDELPERNYLLKGVVDPLIDQLPLLPDLMERHIPIYREPEEFYHAGMADLAVIASPIHMHVPQSMLAIRKQSHVLCDKPLASTIQEANMLIREAGERHSWISIGYQWSFSKAIRDLKMDILQGRYGKATRFKSLILWPRDYQYYLRNEWAGRMKTSGGKWILDSPANNAMAHFLHNMFYLLGPTMETSAQPASLVAEAYKAYMIENFDTINARIKTTEGTELLFFASHVTERPVPPMFTIELEHATVTFSEKTNDIVAVDNTGTEIHYGSPDAEHQFRKLFLALEAFHSDEPAICPPQAACAQTLCMNGIQDSVHDIMPFPARMIKGNGVKLWINGLASMMQQCYHKNVLLHEIVPGWTVAGKNISLINYSYFPGGAEPGKGKHE